MGRTYTERSVIVWSVENTQSRVTCCRVMSGFSAETGPRILVAPATEANVASMVGYLPGRPESLVEQGLSWTYW